MRPKTKQQEEAEKDPLEGSQSIVVNNALIGKNKDASEEEEK
jgi:hypothetical protein